MTCTLSDEVRQRYPHIRVSLLAVEVGAVGAGPGLEEEKRALSEAISRDALSSEVREIIAQYDRYFARFEKDYPIKYQLESIRKGKGIPSPSPAVAAMFMAELKNGYLTAGHDAARLRGGLATTVANGGEAYTAIGGKPHTLKPGDIATADGESFISSVLYGPDERTRITGATRRVLYFSYFPFPVDPREIRRHNADILAYLSNAGGDALACEGPIIVE
jgi:DNA/RNA-binding domain of Phe-tRNA-synthetase-like protein